MSSEFRYEGAYRDQSRRRAVPSLLAGRWRVEPGTLTTEDVNAALRKSSQWTGTAHVALRIADVSERTGTFAEVADALYYHSSFTAAPGTTGLDTDVLDLTKLEAHWHRRRSGVIRLLGEPGEALVTLVEAGGMDAIACDEYLCHEAGHAMGRPVGDKQRSGYFRPGGTVAWPLVFAEEHRADLHGLHLAAGLLDEERAGGIFAYHLLHRFGAATESAATGSPNAGAVPFLLFCALLDIGFLVPAGDAAVVDPASVASGGLLTVLRRCGERGVECTERELRAPMLLDVAVDAARTYRQAVLDEERVMRWRRWLRCTDLGLLP